MWRARKHSIALICIHAVVNLNICQAIQAAELPAYWVYVRTLDFIIASIDSRMGDFPRSYKDNYCKIIVASPKRFVFAAGVAGTETNGKMDFDITTTIRNTPQISSLDDFARSVVTTFAHAFHQSSSNQRSNDFTDIYFFEDDQDDVPRIINGHLSFKPSGIEQSLGTVLPDVRLSYSGRHEGLFDEIFSLQTVRAKVLVDQIRNRYGGNSPIDQEAGLLTGVVQGIIDWSGDTTVGGNVATIILERGKPIRWYVRPSFCPE